MRLTDYLIHLTLSVILIIRVYQFYFWCQRNSVLEPRELRLRIDEYIPYLLYRNFVLETPREFTHAAASFVLLLRVQPAALALGALPCACPWRCAPRCRASSPSSIT
jgi:hypothetical protein